MRTLPAYPIEENKALRALGRFAYPSSSLDVLGATAEEAWATNPIPSLWQMLPTWEADKIITPEEANARYGIDKELQFDAPVQESDARYYNKSKREELARRDIFQRSQGGALLSAAQFGVGLAVSMVDPINIASAFIPVVGPARYAVMLGKAAGAAGRAGIRTAVGAAEGLVGAAVVEPLIYAAATQRQADYDATDSLLNLAFGTVLGGGLHSGLGALGDAIRAKKLDEPLLRESVAAVIEDRPVTVEAQLRASLAESTGLEGVLRRAGEGIPGVSEARPMAASQAQVAGVVPGADDVPTKAYENPSDFSQDVIKKINEQYPGAKFTVKSWSNDAGKSAYIEMIGGSALRISDHGIGAKRFGAEGGWVDYKKDSINRAVEFFKNSIMRYDIAEKSMGVIDLGKYTERAADIVSINKYGMQYNELSNTKRKRIENEIKNKAKDFAQSDINRRKTATDTESWIIKNKETGEVLFETWQRSLIDNLNTKKYEAVQILDEHVGIGAIAPGITKAAMTQVAAVPERVEPISPFIPLANAAVERQDAIAMINKQYADAYAPGVKSWEATEVRAIDDLVLGTPMVDLDAARVQSEIADFEALAGALDESEAAFIKEADDMNSFADQFAVAAQAVARCRIGRA